MNNLIFAFMPNSELQTLVLVRSLRKFGGAFSGSPVWVLDPPGADTFSVTAQDELAALDVRLIPFEVSPDVLEFPFAGKVFASAAAEALAQRQTKLFVWMDSDTLVINEPDGLLIPADKQLGYCPVHHRLIGSLYNEPLDPFWSLIYERCAVPTNRVFPMRTIVDEVNLRPYFNTGLMVTRPENGLLSVWRDRFGALYQEPCFELFYEQHVFYRIFIHQVVLAGVVLASLEQADLQELSRLFNYPLHLYAEHTPERRPAKISDLVTCRYETVFNQPGWQESLPITDPLKEWLEVQFGGQQ